MDCTVSDLRTCLFSYAAEVLPMNVNINEGATLTLNCSITNGDRFAEFNSSSVFFEVTFSETDETETITGQFYATLGPHISQLSIPNISVNDSGTYKCVIQDHMLGATEVTVGSKLYSSCISFMFF
jgi:Immunoglobulin domain